MTNKAAIPSSKFTVLRGTGTLTWQITFNYKSSPSASKDKNRFSAIDNNLVEVGKVRVFSIEYSERVLWGSNSWPESWRITAIWRMGRSQHLWLQEGGNNLGMCANTQCMSDGQKQRKVLGPYVRDRKKVVFFRVSKAAKGYESCHSWF